MFMIFVYALVTWIIFIIVYIIGCIVYSKDGIARNQIWVNKKTSKPVNIDDINADIVTVIDHNHKIVNYDISTFRKKFIKRKRF